MTLSRGAKVRAVIAVVVGVPGTVLFTPLLSVPLLTGALSLADLQSLSHGVLFLIWGLAGVAGLIGFWGWVFCRPPLSKRQRVLISVSILAGVCAVAPVTLGANVYASSLAAVGVVLGLAIGSWVVLPNSPLNPDARAGAVVDHPPSARAG